MTKFSKPGILLLVLAIIAGCAPEKSAETLWQDAGAYISDKKYDEAIDAYKSIIDKHKDSEYYVQAIFMLADTYMKFKQEYDLSVAEYRKIVENHKDSEYAPMSLFMIGYIFNNYLKDMDRAQAAYNEFTTTFPDHELNSSVKWELENLGKDLSDIESLKDITSNKGE